MPKVGKLFTNVKEFAKTYSSTIKIVWNINRSLLIRITLVNALNGALVYPSLLVSKQLIDAVMNAVATHDITVGIKNMIIATVAGLLIDRVKQILQEFDHIYSDQISDILKEKGTLVRLILWY